MTIEKFLGPASVFDWVGLVIMGSTWFGLTVGILCIMEVCFDAMRWRCYSCIRFMSVVDADVMTGPIGILTRPPVALG